MRHRNHRSQLGKTSSHRRCMGANMIKSLIRHGGVRTTLAKAKWVRRQADRMVSVAKRGSLSDRRRVAGTLMLCGDRPSSKKWRNMRAQGIVSGERQILHDLFGGLATRFAHRQGGYTRITKLPSRRGDGAKMCMIQYVDE